MSKIGGKIASGNTVTGPAGILHVPMDSKFDENCGAPLVNVAAKAIDKITKNFILGNVYYEKSHSFNAVLLATESWILLITFKEIVRPFILNSYAESLQRQLRIFSQLSQQIIYDITNRSICVNII